AAVNTEGIASACPAAQTRSSTNGGAVKRDVIRHNRSGHSAPTKISAGDVSGIDLAAGDDPFAGEAGAVAVHEPDAGAGFGEVSRDINRAAAGAKDDAARPAIAGGAVVESDGAARKRQRVGGVALVAEPVGSVTEFNNRATCRAGSDGQRAGIGLIGVGGAGGV